MATRGVRSEGDRGTNNGPPLQQAIDWLRRDCALRESARSWGEATVRLVWEDGYIRSVEVIPRQTVKPGGSDRLYGGGG